MEANLTGRYFISAQVVVLKLEMNECTEHGNCAQVEHLTRSEQFRWEHSWPQQSRSEETLSSIFVVVSIVSALSKLLMAPVL